jgi:hypothetical protein
LIFSYKKKEQRPPSEKKQEIKREKNKARGPGRRATASALRLSAKHRGNRNPENIEEQQKDVA